MTTEKFFELYAKTPHSDRFTLLNVGEVKFKSKEPMLIFKTASDDLAQRKTWKHQRCQRAQQVTIVIVQFGEKKKH